MKFQKIIFQDKPYILIGESLSTIEAFKNGGLSYAMIFGDNIERYGKIIGTRKDITFLDEYVEIKLTIGILGKHLGGLIKEALGLILGNFKRL